MRDGQDLPGQLDVMGAHDLLFPEGMDDPTSVMGRRIAVLNLLWNSAVKAERESPGDSGNLAESL